MTLAGAGFSAGVAGAQSGPAPSDPVSDTVPPLRTPTTLADVPNENCAPGNIVRAPDCGRVPESPGDPGGWLQVSLFFLVCGVIVLMAVSVWRLSRKARNARKAAGQDPVSLARASGQGVRRSTRNEPVAATSSNSPESSAGR